MKAPARRNLDAEVRAVEEGHRAYVQDGGWVRVVSDRFEGTGKHYRVEVEPAAPGRGIGFSCRPAGFAAFEEDHKVATAEPGIVPCKHAALAARRLEREGLAVLVAGRWVYPGQPETHPCRTCGADLEGRGSLCGRCLLEQM